MGNLTTALVIMLSINAVFILAQASMLELNPESDIIINCSNTMYNTLSSGCNSLVLNDTNPSNRLPSGETSVNTDTGEVYTDTFTTSRTWMLETSGLGYVVSLLSGPYNLLKTIGFPPAFSFVIGGLWYGVTLFLIVAFLLGRND